MLTVDDIHLTHVLDPQALRQVLGHHCMLTPVDMCPEIVCDVELLDKLYDESVKLPDSLSLLFLTWHDDALVKLYV